jgi:lysophospholipase L1-like esterase
MIIKKGSKILFQGDSITDSGRDRENDTLGFGYVNYISAFFQSMYPEHGCTFINRGISGNRSSDLCERWTRDCIDLRPDVLSIMIGINDTWRKFDSNDPTTDQEFYDNYRQILSRTADELGDIPIIMLEPFVLPHPEDRLLWREDLDPKIQRTRQLAREFGAIYIPLDGIFAQKCTHVSPAFWAADGVHPTSAGHALIARLWLKAITGVDIY